MINKRPKEVSGEFERLTGVNSAKLVRVLEVKSLAGNGNEKSVMHEVTEYYSTDGELLARRTFRDDLSTGHFLETLPSGNGLGSDKDSLS